MISYCPRWTQAPVRRFHVRKAAVRLLGPAQGCTCKRRRSLSCSGGTGMLNAPKTMQKAGRDGMAGHLSMHMTPVMSRVTVAIFMGNSSHSSCVCPSAAARRAQKKSCRRCRWRLACGASDGGGCALHRGALRVGAQYSFGDAGSLSEVVSDGGIVSGFGRTKIMQRLRDP
eukprot:3707616-Prymnesium_polylepis.2